MPRFQALRVGGQAPVINAGTLTMASFAGTPEPPAEWPIASENMYRRGDPNYPLVVAAGKKYDPAIATQLIGDSEMRAVVYSRPKSPAPQPPTAAEAGDQVVYPAEETGPPLPAPRRSRR